MKRVLVTGAAGFVGRHAVAPLLARGYEIEAVSTREAGQADPRVRWHRVDLLDADAMRAMVERAGASHLLHFAWYTEHRRFWDAPVNEAWVEASLVLVRAFRERGGRRAVLAGSCAEYGPQESDCVESLTPCRPSTLYGRCKLALHDRFMAYCRDSGLSGAWGRIFFLYGPGEHRDRLVAAVARALLAGERARCTHGRQVRDFLHVADVADAFVALLDGDVEGAVNIASGVPLELREIVLALADALAARDRVDLGVVAAPPDEPPRIVADVARLRDEVRWRPRHDLRSGLADAIAARRRDPAA